MTLYRNKYRIESTRLQNWDYRWNGPYFITICTAHRKYYFGEIRDGKMQLSHIGQLAQEFWTEIPKHFPLVKLDAFVIMPNHVHGILILNGNVVEPTHALSLQTIGQKRFQHQGKNSVSSIIGSYKSVVTKHARTFQADFEWQPLFHDRIIRDNMAYNRIKQYIINNPQNWKEDNFFH